LDCVNPSKKNIEESRQEHTQFKPMVSTNPDIKNTSTETEIESEIVNKETETYNVKVLSVHNPTSGDPVCSATKIEAKKLITSVGFHETMYGSKEHRSIVFNKKRDLVFINTPKTVDKLEHVANLTTDRISSDCETNFGKYINHLMVIFAVLLLALYTFCPAFVNLLFLWTTLLLGSWTHLRKRFVNPVEKVEIMKNGTRSVKTETDMEKNLEVRHVFNNYPSAASKRLAEMDLLFNKYEGLIYLRASEKINYATLSSQLDDEFDDGEINPSRPYVSALVEIHLIQHLADCFQNEILESVSFLAIDFALKDSMFRQATLVSIPKRIKPTIENFIPIERGNIQVHDTRQTVEQTKSRVKAKRVTIHYPIETRTMEWKKVARMAHPIFNNLVVPTLYADPLIGHPRAGIG
jgi:hypothetical protein